MGRRADITSPHVVIDVVILVPATAAPRLAPSGAAAWSPVAETAASDEEPENHRHLADEAEDSEGGVEAVDERDADCICDIADPRDRQEDRKNLGDEPGADAEVALQDQERRRGRD
jgi:hypothetical protein